MKIALVADIHGNVPALEAMDAHLRTLSPDEIWFLGDAVGKGPGNAETCDWVMNRCTHALGGNWDYGIGCKQFPQDHYYWNQLGVKRMAWLAALPAELELMMSGIRFRLFHGRPVTKLITVDGDKELLESCFQSEAGTFGGVICADSHRPFFRTMRPGYLMNTGSVGNSLGVTRAHGLLLEGDRGDVPGPLNVTVLSLPYDRERAIRLAQEDQDLPFADAYINEIRTGSYSR